MIKRLHDGRCRREEEVCRIRCDGPVDGKMGGRVVEWAGVLGIGGYEEAKRRGDKRGMNRRYG